MCVCVCVCVCVFNHSVFLKQIIVIINIIIIIINTTGPYFCFKYYNSK